MTIAVLCAIPEEREALSTSFNRSRLVEIGRLRFEEGHLDGVPVVLVGAGIGKVNTAIAATLLVERFNASLIIFTGVAGGLDPALKIGDLVIADRTIQHDAGWIEAGTIHTYQAGHVPFFNPTDRLGYSAPAAALQIVTEIARDMRLPALPAAAGGDGTPPSIVVGTILSGDQYIHCEDTRRRLHADLGGVAVEMEGGALGQVCEAMGVEWLDIRALSDLAGATSRHDFKTFVEWAASSSAILLHAALPSLDRHLLDRSGRR